MDSMVDSRASMKIGNVDVTFVHGAIIWSLIEPMHLPLSLVGNENQTKMMMIIEWQRYLSQNLCSVDDILDLGCCKDTSWGCTSLSLIGLRHNQS